MYIYTWEIFICVNKVRRRLDIHLFVNIEEDKIYYNANTQGGQSGGPVFGTNNVVCGVHNTGYYRVLSDGTIEYVSNGAARIVPLNYSLFQEKKNEGIALYY